MPLETANFITELDETWPLGTDNVSQGDDQIRLIKAVLKSQFPNLDSAVTASPGDLNNPGNASGTMAMFAGSTAPTGYLICDGSAISRTANAALYTAIGTVWGNGDGSTTFNIPDMRNRVAGGASTNALGSIEGKDTHGSADVIQHKHTTISNGSHIHGLLRRNDGAANPVNDFYYEYGQNAIGSYNNGSPQSLTKEAGSHTHTINNTGAATVDNRQATAYVNYIIKI